MRVAQGSQETWTVGADNQDAKCPDPIPAIARWLLRAPSECSQQTPFAVRKSRKHEMDGREAVGGLLNEVRGSVRRPPEQVQWRAIPDSAPIFSSCIYQPQDGGLQLAGLCPIVWCQRLLAMHR